MQRSSLLIFTTSPPPPAFLHHHLWMFTFAEGRSFEIPQYCDESSRPPHPRAACATCGQGFFLDLYRESHLTPGDNFYSTMDFTAPRRRVIVLTNCIKWLGPLFLLGIILLLISTWEERDSTRSIVHAKSPVISRTFQATPPKRHSREVAECTSNETVTSQGGMLTSPGFPTRYPSNLDCRWLLTASDDTSIVLRIKSLDLERGRQCELDYLQIHLGPTTLSPIQDRLCGTIKEKVIATNSSTVLIVFHSDPSYEDKGFQIDYYLQSSAGCLSTLTEVSGAITSPNFPANYPDNTDCWTLISVAEGKQIILQFDSIDLEFDQNCTYDFIQVFDGPSRDAPSRGTFCTNNRVPIQSTSNELLLYFHSDHLVNKKGFHAQYSTTKAIRGLNVKDLGGCLWESEDRNGTIASPNYPQNYPSNADCKLLLRAPINEVISIEFDMLQLEVEANCSYDYLELTDGTDLETIYRMCGKPNELQKLTSSQNILLVIFHSDDFAEFSGFKARYWFHKPTNATQTAEDSKTQEATSKTTTASTSSNDDIFIERPENATLRFGSPYLLHCAVSDPVAKIRWLKDGLFLGGNTPLPGLKLVANNTLWIQSMTKQLTGIYTCAALTPERTYYAKASLTLENGPDLDDSSCSIVLLKRPRNSTFSEGDFVHLECTAAGSQVQIFWEKDGLPLDPKRNITVLKNGFLFKENVAIQDSGVYTCVATDSGNSCQIRVPITLKIHAKARLMEICGVPKVGQPSGRKPHLDHGKIVGGHNTKKGAYPWQVMLWEPHLKSFCGGSLINEHWIVTAAHCLMNYVGLRWNDIVVKLGKYNRELKEEEEIQTAIGGPSSIVVHPAYNKETFDNDIALIRLRDHIEFTDHILPICLGSWELFEDEKEEDVRMGIVTGWGKLKDSGPSPKFLQEIQLPIVKQETCIASTSFLVTRNMFCAGYAQEILGDACKGDSGGPFVVNKENRFYLAGIVSWGEGCGLANKYGFYTKVINYLSWIKGIMKS